MFVTMRLAIFRLMSHPGCFRVIVQCPCADENICWIVRIDHFDYSPTKTSIRAIWSMSFFEKRRADT